MPVDRIEANVPVSFQSAYSSQGITENATNGTGPFVRRDSASSGSSQSSNDNHVRGGDVALPMDSQSRIPGLLGSTPIVPQEPGTPGEFIPYLSGLYRDLSFDMTKNPSGWKDLLTTRSDWLHRNGFSMQELDEASQFMQDVDRRTDGYAGMVSGGLPFGAAGLVVGQLAGAATAYFGPWWGPLLTGAGVAVCERAFGGALTTESMDLHYSKVPRPGDMLHPAVAKQYADVQPTRLETMHVHNWGFGKGYGTANALRLGTTAITTAAGFAPSGTELVDAVPGIVLGGGITGRTVGQQTRDQVLAMTLARHDFDRQMENVRVRKEQGPVSNFVDTCGSAARHGTELVTSAVASVFPPKLSGYVLGDPYGPKPEASLYQQYMPKALGNVCRPSTLTNAAVLGPYVLLTGMAGDEVAGFLPENSADVVKAVVKKAASGAAALPFFATGGYTLVGPGLVENDVLEWFDCCSGEPDTPDNLSRTDASEGADSPHSSIQMERLHAPSALNVDSTMLPLGLNVPQTDTQAITPPQANTLLLPSDAVQAQVASPPADEVLAAQPQLPAGHQILEIV